MRLSPFIQSFNRHSALLEDGGNAHTAADAQGSQTLLGVVALLHLVQQGDDDTSTGSAHGVTQRDSCLLYTSDAADE